MTDSATHSPVIEVNEANFAAEVEQSPIPVFVDFWAPWCGPCKALAPLFDQMAEAYRDQIKFTKINADDNKALAERFNVRGLPTLLLLRDGQVVENIVGGRSKSGFTNLLDKHVQRPIAAKSAPIRSFRAFQGDESLRESVVVRLRDHIRAGRVVTNHPTKPPVADAEKQRYSLMGGALNDADVAAFENTLSIPGPVGRLQETVHGLLHQQAEGSDDSALRLQPPHDVWPLDWWQSIPPGADLQSLPSRFIAWLLLDRSPEIYPYALSEDARAIMASLANLHLRFARNDAPTDEEWRAVRAAAGDLFKRTQSANREAADTTPGITCACIEMLAWPAHELDDALPEAVGRYLQETIRSDALLKAYTPDQWKERNAAQKAYAERLERSKEEFADKTFEKLEDVPLEFRKEMEELQARMAAAAERRKPFEAAVTGKATRAYGERLHAGLMLALKDTVSGT